ncbi:MAG TPA: transcription termination/antitermination NusG family protein [Bryobacteraceae bacterium]|nr:transcription termination/antitermination NusG family protein [Bryobacteraceae bacterium]
MRWYALMVKRRSEKTIALILEHKGHRGFVPMCCSRERRSDRIVETEEPLFPGYLFCRFDLNDRRVPILTTPGVIRILGVGNTPSPVADEEVAAIQRIVSSGLPAQKWRYVDAGSAVQIMSGSLAGVKGLFVKAKNGDRLVVSVTLLRRSVAVEIDAALVAPIWGARLSSGTEGARQSVRSVA